MVKRVLRLCVVFVFLSFSAAWAGTVRIEGGSTYPGIQAAVDAAAAGNHIQISTGMFYEAVLVNKNLDISGGYDESFTSRPGGFTGINAGDGASAIWFNSSTCHVDQVQFLNGTANAFTFFCGGGAVLNNSWVEFTDSSIYSNVAIYGGGLFVDELSYARLSGNSPVHKNIALWRGGGVHVRGALNILSEDSDIYNNVVSNGYGGGIWVENGRLTVTGGDIYGNRAIGETTDSSGGGIAALGAFMDFGGNVSISNNWAKLGGGIGMLDSTSFVGHVTMGDVVINQNLGDYGGGLYALGSHIGCRGVYLLDNYSTVEGGGGWLMNSQLISDTNLFYVAYNRSWIDGGGLYLVSCTASLDTAVFGGGPGTGNDANGYGGGIYATCSTIFVQGGQFIGNTADMETPSSANGGAIWATQSSLEFTNGTGHWGSYTNVIFQYNYAGTNIGRGGAIYLTNDAHVSWFNVNADYNRAYDGGVLYAEQGCHFLLNNSQLNRNRAYHDGGAIYTLSDATVDGCTFSANSALSWGGALAMYECMMDANRCRFIGNTSLVAGTAISTFGRSHLKISSPPDDAVYSPVTGWASLFEQNQGPGDVVYISFNSTADISRAAFLSNSWAGVDVTQSDATIQGCVFDYSSIMLTQAKVDVSDCTILGLISASQTTLTLSNSIVWNGALNTDEFCHVSAGYCLLPNSIPGPGIVTNPPHLFANYHLTHYSPCIGAGKYVDDVYLRDIDGELRFGRADIGFDEYEDTDNDRLPTIFETRTGYLVDDFNQGSNPTNSDTDSDGVLDGDEWLAATDPNLASSCLKITGIHRDENSMRIDWQGGVWANQVIESSSNLPTGPCEWTYEMVFSAPTATELNWLSLMWHSNTFYRIRAYR
ncbi:MAG TPA: hypothetical protein DCZ95_09670 [Verrucomicrobia bacterium]|nr:MAG: hypothetical protein A2X46_07225 [Lentisphaerae bacterium GWF2_57_35]HBA84348.1 hypothetical protein [Verrucomicrobiota bacterium]